MKLAFAVPAAVAFLGFVGAQEEGTSVTVGNDDKCLEEMNAVREGVGLPGFSPIASPFPQVSGESGKVWGPFCDFLLPTPSKPAALSSDTGASERFKDGAYALAKLESEDPNCSATVQQWQSAFKNFNGLPPNKKGTNLYKNPDTLSFVALFNPGEDPAASCRVVTCKKEESIARALLCLTTPPALGEDKAPFTQDQWNSLSAALTKAAAGAAASASLSAAAVALSGAAAALLI